MAASDAKMFLTIVESNGDRFTVEIKHASQTFTTQLPDVHASELPNISASVTFTYHFNDAARVTTMTEPILPPSGLQCPPFRAGPLRAAPRITA